MFRKLKGDFSLLAKGKPGKRFVEHHECHRQSRISAESRWKSLAYFLTAGLLLLAGLLLSLPPGLPGFLLWLPALGMLAARLRILAVALDQMELLLRRLYKRLRRPFRRR